MVKISTNPDNSKQDLEKEKYKTTNWFSYNKSLISRGDITLWIDEDSISDWYYQGPPQRGSQYVYSDICIETLLCLKAVFPS